MRWMELRLLLLLARSHLWEGVVRARFNMPFVSSWFSSLAWFTFGAGPGPRREETGPDQSILSLMGERALCALDSNVPALRRNAKAFCRVVLLRRMCFVSPRGSLQSKEDWSRTQSPPGAPRAWVGLERGGLSLCSLSQQRATALLPQDDRGGPVLVT